MKKITAWDEALITVLLMIMVVALAGKTAFFAALALYIPARLGLLAARRMLTAKDQSAGLTLKYVRQTPDGTAILGFLLYNRGTVDLLIEDITSTGVGTWVSSITFRNRVSGLLDFLPDKNVEKVMWINGKRQGDGTEIISIPPGEHIGIEYIAQTAAIKSSTWRAQLIYSLPPHTQTHKAQLYGTRQLK